MSAKHYLIAGRSFVLKELTVDETESYERLMMSTGGSNTTLTMNSDTAAQLMHLLLEPADTNEGPTVDFFRKTKTKTVLAVLADFFLQSLNEQINFQSSLQSSVTVIRQHLPNTEA